MFLLSTSDSMPLGQRRRHHLSTAPALAELGSWTWTDSKEQCLPQELGFFYSFSFCKRICKKNVKSSAGFFLAFLFYADSLSQSFFVVRKEWPALRSTQWPSLHPSSWTVYPFLLPLLLQAKPFSLWVVSETQEIKRVYRLHGWKKLCSTRIVFLL